MVNLGISLVIVLLNSAGVIAIKLLSFYVLVKESSMSNNMSSIIFTWHSDSGSIDNFAQGLSLAQASGASSLLVLACYENHFTIKQVNPLLSRCSLPVFGGIYPKLIYKNKLIVQGCIIIGFQQLVEISLLTQLSEFENDEALEQAIEQSLLKQSLLGESDGVLMFYDALIDNAENFIDCLFECLDYPLSIIGGGAGNLAFTQEPCIFTNQGLVFNAIQIVNLKSKMTTAATHGWQILQGPFLVSEAEKHTIKSLDYQPAFNVYKAAVEGASEHRFNENDFFDIAKNFPLGIERLNSKLVVRDPILVHEGNVQCVGNIPVNSMVYLLKGSIESLISSAEQAAISVTKKIDAHDFSATMIFDCISRILYLEDNFTRELDVIAKHCSEQQALFGVLSLGEIANSESGAIRLLNKSTVIGSW